MAINVRADTLFLKNGNKVKCDIIKETDDAYVVKIYDGTVEFSKNEVRSVIREEPYSFDQQMEKVKESEKGEVPSQLEFEIYGAFLVGKSTRGSYEGGLVTVHLELYKKDISLSEEEVEAIIKKVELFCYDNNAFSLMEQIELLNKFLKD